MPLFDTSPSKRSELRRKHDRTRWSLLKRPTVPLKPQARDAYHLKRELADLQLKYHQQSTEMEVLKEELQKQRYETEDWKERWNHQNLKLQILMDMWALREIEQSHSEASQRFPSKTTPKKHPLHTEERRTP